MGRAYQRDGFNFVQRVCGSVEALEAESGLAEFQKAADDFAADMDAWDDEGVGEGGDDF